MPIHQLQAFLLPLFLDREIGRDRNVGMYVLLSLLRVLKATVPSYMKKENAHIQTFIILLKIGQMDPILSTLYLSKSSRQFDSNLSFPKFISLEHKVFKKNFK